MGMILNMKQYNFKHYILPKNNNYKLLGWKQYSYNCCDMEITFFEVHHVHNNKLWNQFHARIFSIA